MWHTGSVGGAGVVGAGHRFVTYWTLPPFMALARERIQLILTVTMPATRIRTTVVDVNLTIISGIPRHALTLVCRRCFVTKRSVLARIVSAGVRFRLTFLAFKSSLANALIVARFVVTFHSITRDARRERNQTLVDVGCTEGTGVSCVALAFVGTCH